MAFMKWNDSLSVKVGEIDGQHQKLIALINQLHDAMAQGKGKDAVSLIVKGLVGYAGSHFALEEKYFDKFNYPDAPAHKQEHAAFVNKVSEFQDKYTKGGITLTLEVMNFLKDWLVKHIQGTDQRYSAFFNERGLN
jgi:hemerythrin-like metal-binding protein